ncbi:MAG: TetR/AcrR family transcriptional regulator [Syntrophobacteraceae bacterium]
MKSKSRNTSKEQIIIKAATKVLGQYGYERATISLIAAEAGVSRGLLHYYFKSKEELLEKIIKDYTEVGTAEVAEIFNDHHTPAGYAEGITRWFKDAILNEPYLFSSWYEGVTLVRHSGPISRVIAASYIEWKQAFEVGLKQAQEKQIIAPAPPVKALAALISALLDGLGLQFLSEPELLKDNLIWESFEACIVSLLKSKQ